MVGIHLVAATFVGFAMGFALDSWLHTKPWFMGIGFILGLITGFRDLFRMVKKESENDTADS
jgi:ATP synthase protein I